MSEGKREGERKSKGEARSRESERVRERASEREREGSRGRVDARGSGALVKFLVAALNNLVHSGRRAGESTAKTP